MNESRTGDIAEMVACTWLLRQGYEVFRNVSCVGPIDIVAHKAGELILIDSAVPTTAKGKPYRNKRKELKAQESGAKVLYVLHDGRCMWPEDVAAL